MAIPKAKQESFGDKARRCKPMLWQVAQGLTPSPRAGEGFYNCPWCGSGTGEHGTGTLKLILTAGDEHCICFRCRNEKVRGERSKCTYDAVDLYCKLHGVDKFRAVDELLGYASATPAIKQGGAEKRPAPIAKVEKHFTRRNFETWARTLWNEYAEPARKYLRERGISEPTARKHCIGAVYYYEVWWLIIPTGRYETGLKRACGDSGKYSPKQKIGNACLWNVEEIGKSLEPLWVCEGEFDGLSIVEAGGKAIALGGVGNADLAIESLLEHESKGRTILVCMDYDRNERQAGQKTEAYITKKLTEGGMTCYSVGEVQEMYGVKDINEMLVKDRAELVETVRALSARNC